MKAVILVGGEGTRLQPLTLSTPKQMLPVVGAPMIERVLGHLAAHGVDAAVLSLGYLPDAFLRAYPDGVAAGVALSYAVEPSPLDTAGAIRFAAEHGGVDETLIVLNGDVLTDFDIGALVRFHRERRAEATIGLHPVPDPSAFGVVTTDEEGRVSAFVEKPRRDDAPTNLINAGVYVLEPSALDAIPPGRRVSIERETFPLLVGTGALYALGDDAYWLDTGTHRTYLQAHRDLLSGRRGDPPSPGAVLVDHQVWVTGSPKLVGAVSGPTWVGEGTEVATCAQVEGSAVGPQCVIESGATVVGSVLLEGARVAADSTVAGSILGPGSTVGERCCIRPLSVLGAGAVVASGTELDGERVPG